MSQPRAPYTRPSVGPAALLDLAHRPDTPQNEHATAVALSLGKDHELTCVMGAMTLCALSMLVIAVLR